MNFLDYIDTAFVDIVIALFKRVHLDASIFLPARLDQFVDQSGTASNITSVLSQIALVVCVVSAGVLVFAIAGKRALKHALTPEASADAAPELVPQAATSGALRERWNEILVHLESPRENDWKQAVLEADKLVETALARAGFPGDTFGDRLGNIQAGTLVSLDGLGWAHGVRNRIAHEMDYFLRYTEARAAMSYFEATLAELQLL